MAGELITYAQVMAIANTPVVDVLLTHDVPAGTTFLQNRYDLTDTRRWPAERVRESDKQRLLLREVFDTVLPSLVLHGHHHIRYDEQFEGATVMGLANDGNPFDENMLVLR